MCQSINVDSLRLVLAYFLFLFAMPMSAQTLSMAEAVQLAQQRDLVQAQLKKQDAAAREQSVALRSLPNPQLKIGLQNLPTDSFDLDQEAMTQWRLGVSQQFPAGNTLKLTSKAAQVNGNIWAAKSKERQLQMSKEVRLLWLEAVYRQNATQLLLEDKEFLQQMLRISQSLYSVGRKNQQDLIQVELEIQRLEEKLILSRSELVQVHQRLARWVGEQASLRTLPTTFSSHLQIALESLGDDPVKILLRHPLVTTVEHQVNLQETKVDLAKQAYKPRWGTEVAYGYRDGKNPDGSDRSDFFSAMVSVEMPFFTEKRQDKKLSAAKLDTAAKRDLRNDMLRRLKADYKVMDERRQQLKARRLLYESQILKLSAQQSKATLSAYESDTTDFSELMRAYLNDQSTKLLYQRLLTDEQKVLAELHYLVVNELVVNDVGVTSTVPLNTKPVNADAFNSETLNSDTTNKGKNHE